MKLKWVKFTTDEERKDGYNLCPICKSDLEIEIDDTVEKLIHKERCVKGCYIYNFDTRQREK